MNKTDARFSSEERSLLSKLIGTRFESFQCDEFTVAQFSYGVVWIRAGGMALALTDFARPLEYLGCLDDFAAGAVRLADEEEIATYLVKRNQRVWPVGGVIEDIRLYDDTIKATAIEGEALEYASTTAVVFQLEGTQVAFELGCVLSELIHIGWGPDAEKELPPAESAIPEEDRDWTRAEREVVSLRG